MVLGVCRRVLGRPARRRRRLPGDLPGPGQEGPGDPRPRRPGDLAVRRRAAGRGPRRVERPSATIARSGPVRRDWTWTRDHRATDRLEAQELRSAIDDELERLPARYRAPVVLCDLEGQTHEQAAAQLGCPVGTVKSRLSRGRDQLRSRLVRRGVAPTAGLLAATLAAESAHAVPVELMSLTLGAATQVAAGKAVAAGASSAGAASLTKGVLRSMFLVKIQLAAAALAAAALATIGVRALVGPAATQARRQAKPARRQRPGRAPAAAGPDAAESAGRAVPAGQRPEGHPPADQGLREHGAGRRVLHRQRSRPRGPLRARACDRAPLRDRRGRRREGPDGRGALPSIPRGLQRADGGSLHRALHRVPRRRSSTTSWATPRPG